ncbi:MAG: DUF3990 domain-containing protein [Candidatus Riflebacteria bacterium]|nr:DUF3990 domain-containing protein [Candidatus Riflebacteria bacterium]
MTERFVYHGSNIIVDKPKILTNGFFKDFGYGFYCTNLEKQAKRWAMTRRNNHIVNVYKLKELDAFNKLIFDSMNKDWLNFIVNCRRGLEHNYDVVEGPMADDTIWNFIEDYIGGDISKEAFWELVKFRYPTHQIVFCNEKALQAVIFERAYSL